MRRIIALVILILIFLFSPRLSFASSWSVPLKLNEDSGLSFQRSPAISFYNQKPVAVWKDPRDGKDNIYSFVGGAEVKVNDSDIGHRGNPDVLRDISVWPDYRTGIDLYYSKLVGNAWQGNAVVRASASSPNHISLSESLAGNVGVVWHAYENATSWGIYYSTYIGGNWTEVERITNTVNAEMQPSLAFLGETPFVVWSVPEYYGNVLKYSFKEEAVWVPAKPIDTGLSGLATAQHPALISNRLRNKMALLWLDYYTRRDIYVSFYDGISKSFGERILVSGAGSAPAGAPAGVFDSDDNLWVVWQDARGGQEQIYVDKISNSNSPQTDELVFPSTYSQSVPDIAYDSGKLAVVWEQDSASSGSDIYYSNQELESVSPKEPILIVPGMTASWSFSLSNNKELSDWRLFPVLGERAYEGLIKTVEDAGFDTDSFLYVVPYDWRKSHTEIVEKFLKPAIDKAKLNSPTGKVDIIAHSQGGIVGRTYIQGSLYENDVDTLVTVGSPHSGTPKAYYPWEGGEAPQNYMFLMKGLYQMLLNIYYDQEGGMLSRQDVNQKYFPSNKEILPVYDFLRGSDGNLLDFASLSSVNNFLLDLNNQEFLPIGVHFKNLVGTGFDTAKILNILPHSWEDGGFWIDGKPIGEEMIDGDGTVTGESATSPFAEDIETVNLGHTDLIAKVQGIQKICEMVGAECAEYFSGVTVKSALHINVRSPATLFVTSPSGKSIGFDPETQTYINELENADILGKEDDFKWLVVGNPEDGNYSVNVIGTGDGPYHLSVVTENEESFSIKDLEGKAVLGSQDKFGVAVNSENTEETKITDTTGEIFQKSAEAKILELEDYAKRDKFQFIFKDLVLISRFSEKSKSLLALKQIYDLRKEITLRIPDINKRVFYKEKLNSIAEDLSEYFANNEIIGKKVAEIEIRQANKEVNNAKKMLYYSTDSEFIGVLKLCENNLSKAAESFQYGEYTRAFIRAIQAEWLARETMLFCPKNKGKACN